jgi:ATP-dependent RNA helicase DeaD
MKKMKQFEKLLGKENPLAVSVEKRGFNVPSEIQEKSIPSILEGKDVVAAASTGSGKTLAFAAGLINNIEKGKGIQGLVLTPTRELAEQVASEVEKFAAHKKLEVVSVYGGVSFNNQVSKIRTGEIVVATPGRMLDHIKQKTINLEKINTLVLDEADRMFDMGFREDVTEIIIKCPKKRQTLLFSATISDEVLFLAENYLKDPVEISAEEYVDPSKLKQIYYDVPDELKFSLLRNLIEREKSALVMIFCNTRRGVDFVARNLKGSGVDALPIHGGLSQEKRNKVLGDFHSNKVLVLVATDVAARGLDIKGVSHVYNYDIPPNSKEYVHRIGRTARAGEEGKVINIVANRDYENFRGVMAEDFNIERVELPYINKVRMTPDRSDDRERDFMGGYRKGSFKEKRENESRSGGRRNNIRGRGYRSK